MQKITPYLWFDMQAEAAMTLYTSTFPNAQTLSIQRYPAGPLKGPMAGMEAKVLTGIFEIAGQRFMALDGGPIFKFTPAISFFVNGASEAEIDALWATLSDGGSVLMPYQAYPYSPKFGWLEDKNGLSWQISLGARAQKITPFLMFFGQQHGKAEEALNFYISLFENSGIERIQRYSAGEDGGVEGTVKHAIFQLHGQDFMAIDSSLDHGFSFNESISFYVECESQDEVDHFWYKLSSDPRSEQCGWLKDRYGVSWQIVPSVLGELMNDPDADKSKRVMDALLQMKKLDIAGLKRAYMG